MTDNPNNWPDPARPGVPLNPERDGWHWVAFVPGRWVSNPAGGGWILFGNSYGADVAAPCKYGGPCLTAAEVGALVAAARREGAEAMLKAGNDMADAIANMLRVNVSPAPDGFAAKSAQAWRELAFSLPCAASAAQMEARDE